MTKTTNEKLSEMSEILADGYKWLMIRSMLERYEAEAAQGNEQSAELMEIFDRSYRLITVLAKNI